MKLQIILEIKEGDLSGNDESFLRHELFYSVSVFMQDAKSELGLGDFDYNLKCDEVRGEL